ncbi:MAG: hypothetical protein ACRDJJ_06760 [Actinomycetota bacterium]
MIYLVILVLVAAFGILRLWLYQRRHIARMTSIEGFKDGLRAISPETELPTRPTDTQVPAAQSLDADRRAAARRRIEARRRARAAS